MPNHDELRPPSLSDMEEQAMLMPDGPDKVRRLKELAALRDTAAMQAVLRKEIKDKGGGEGLDPPPFPLDYPDE